MKFIEEKIAFKMKLRHLVFGYEFLTKKTFIEDDFSHDNLNISFVIYETDMS